MAARTWSRSGAGYNGGGYIGSNAVNMVGGMGFYVNQIDRRPMYNTSPIGKPYAGFRDEPYRRRDEYRGGNRQKGKSPMSDQRHSDSFGPRKDNRSGKRQQSNVRYEVKIPRMPFTLKSATLPEIKLAHPHLSVPADFSKVCLSWQDAYPLSEPFNVATDTDIYVLHKDVESHITHPPNALEAPDADYSYSVRVMLVATPELGELYKNSFRTVDEPTNTEKTIITKNIHFLVGGRGKSETMGIGGPWSEILDGKDPDTNPQTLINTAIRTFKGLTSIDLSTVTEWTRFMEIRYYRCANTTVPALIEDEETREIPEDKQEVVVFLIPNVAHLMPDEKEWDKTKKIYADALEKLLVEPEVEKMEIDQKEESEAEVLKVLDSTLDDSQDLSEIVPGEPTHYSKLDVNTLKVTELRAELTARNLDIKGVKAGLMTRLQTALDQEKKADIGETKPSETQPVETSTKPAAASSQPKEEIKKLTEKDRRRLERLYRLGDKPFLLVHPNRAARGGRFDCHRVSLHSLLNYQSDEQKEHNFEVSLFAEQFHEMLQRDSAFKIFQAIYIAPEKENKDIKIDQNGTESEPDSKRKKSEADSKDESDNCKVRRIRRTLELQLLFAFTYFDTGYCGFLRDHDLVDILHLLNLGYSKSQMKKLVAKVTTRRDHVQYRNLTDKDIIEGEGADIVNLKSEITDPQFVKDLAAGNDILYDGAKPLIASKVIVTGGNDVNILKRIQTAEEVKKNLEFQFYQIKGELEKSRAHLNAIKDTEDKLRSENREISSKLKEEQKASRDNRVLVNTYNHLLRHSRDVMSNALTEIDKQFDKEKAKKDEERVGLDDAVKPELDKCKTDPESNKNDEKEWEVVDQV